MCLETKLLLKRQAQVLDQLKKTKTKQTHHFKQIERRLITLDKSEQQIRKTILVFQKSIE